MEGLHERSRSPGHGYAQLLRHAFAQRRQEPRQPHRSAERLRLLGVQLQYFEQPALELAVGERLAQPASVPPRVEYSPGGVQSELDAPQAQRLDPVVGDLDAHRESADAREELAVDLPRRGEDFARRPGGRRFGRAPDHQRVLAHFLGHVLGEKRLERRQREAQRQRPAQLFDRAPAEFAQQPAVQRGERPFPVQAECGFTAR
jgi:hypothetical protein